MTGQDLYCSIKLQTHARCSAGVIRLENKGDDEKQWKFHGMPGEFFSLMRLACVGYELYKAGRPGAFGILTDQEKFERTAAEFGITMDAVREQARSMLYINDLIDKYLKEAHAGKKQEEITENSGEDGQEESGS